MGNAANTGIMAQELKGQPGLQGELDASLGYIDLTFKKSKGQLWPGKMDRGQRHFCQASFDYLQGEREFTPESCPVISVALMTAGTHIHAQM